MPRATWRLPVIGASSRNTVAPFADRSHLDLAGSRDGGLEKRGGGVERGEAGDASLDRGAADLKPVFEDGTPVAGVRVDVGHRLDHQLHLPTPTHIPAFRPLFAH